MHVRELASETIFTTTPDASVASAARVMRDRAVGVLPVRDDKVLVGIITDRDIVTKGLAERGDVAGLTVGEIMTKDICACRESDDIAQAADLMAARGVRRLVVVDDDGNARSVLSLGDLSRDPAALTKVAPKIRQACESP